MELVKMKSIIRKLDKKFEEEVKNMNIFWESEKCDIAFIEEYSKLYKYWKIYKDLPDDHVYKQFYHNKIIDIMIDMKVIN